MSKKSNRINVPEAREAMDKFKMEAANDLRVPDCRKNVIKIYLNRRIYPHKAL